MPISEMVKPVRPISESNKIGALFAPMHHQLVKGQKRYPFAKLQVILKKVKLENGCQEIKKKKRQIKV